MRCCRVSRSNKTSLIQRMQQAIDLPEEREEVEQERSIGWTSILDTCGIKEIVHKVYGAHGQTVVPEADDLLNAFRFTPFSELRVVIVGQDPYFNRDELGRPNATGLAFSTRSGALTPSLRRIIEELRRSLPECVPESPSGNLECWARRGVLLINAFLTTLEGSNATPHGRIWKSFTNQLLRELMRLTPPPVILTMGGKARDIAKTVVPEQIHVTCHHPAARPPYTMVGSNVFVSVNNILQDRGEEPIDWTLDER